MVLPFFSRLHCWWHCQHSFHWEARTIIRVEYTNAIQQNVLLGPQKSVRWHSFQIRPLISLRRSQLPSVQVVVWTKIWVNWLRIELCSVRKLCLNIKWKKTTFASWWFQTSYIFGTSKIASVLTTENLWWILVLGSVMEEG